VSSGSLFASGIKKFKVFVESREECFSNWRVGMGLEAHHEEEWCFIGDGVNGEVMGKLGHW